MRVSYVGNFRPSHSTESHLAKTLEKLGHTVIRIQEDATLPTQLIPLAQASDMFLFTRTWGKTVTLEHLEQLRALNIPTVSYHLDLYVGLKRGNGIDSDPFWRTDYVFTPDGDPKSAEFFKAKDINHFYLKPGVFEDECYILPKKDNHDLIFVGSYNYHPEWKYRKILIDWLRRSYRRRFELWGPEGKGTVRGNKLNQLYADSKIAVGDSLCLGFTHQNYWSDRIYECLGRGGFLIHPYIKGLEKEFTDRKHLVFYKYGNFKQLSDLIAYYYRHDDEREAIRHAGHELVKNNYTYTQRLQEMFKIIEENP